jgi:hypothetical protein
MEQIASKFISKAANCPIGVQRGTEEIGGLRYFYCLPAAEAFDFTAQGVLIDAQFPGRGHTPPAVALQGLS